MLNEEQIRMIEMLDKEQQQTIIRMIYYYMFLNWLKEHNIDYKM